MTEQIGLFVEPSEIDLNSESGQTTAPVSQPHYSGSETPVPEIVRFAEWVNEELEACWWCGSALVAYRQGEPACARCGLKVTVEPDGEVIYPDGAWKLRGGELRWVWAPGRRP